MPPKCRAADEAAPETKRRPGVSDRTCGARVLSVGPKPASFHPRPGSRSVRSEPDSRHRTRIEVVLLFRDSPIRVDPEPRSATRSVALATGKVISAATQMAEASALIYFPACGDTPSWDRIASSSK
jgi:hypothetical protein